MNKKIVMKFVAGDQTRSRATQSCHMASAQEDFQQTVVRRVGKMFFCQGDELPPEFSQEDQARQRADAGNKPCENCDDKNLQNDFNLKNDAENHESSKNFADNTAGDLPNNFEDDLAKDFADDFAENFADNLADNLTNNLLDKSGRGLPDYKILQQSQRPAEIAADIYNQMLILQQLYDDLEDFDTLFGEQLEDLSDELDIITRAMQRIYFNLSRRNRPPRQTFSKPRFGTFCAGLDETLPILANTLRDLRRLQRQNISDGLEIQLAIIYFTLNAHQQSLLSMQRTACAK